MTEPLEINVHELHRLQAAHTELLLLDCREPDECDIVAFEDSLRIPIGELEQRLEELKDYRDQRVIVHCHLGGRSLMVTHWLRQQGFTRVQNLAGGIDAWSVQIDPSFRRY